MSSFSFEIDPFAVLGVNSDASLEQIRDAYRRKSKILHPDVGGEEWAFRVLSQSYEMLSTARVMRATRHEPERRRAQQPDPSTDQPHRPERRRGMKFDSDAVRGGIRDQNVPPIRLIGVELLCVRYLWDQNDYAWLSQKLPDDEKFLSCSLNLQWPDQGVPPSQIEEKDAAEIIGHLSDVFDHMVVSTHVVTSRSNQEDDEFTGWLSYSSFDRAWKSLKTLHEALNSRGLGLRQWSRDLYIPKAWN